MWKKGYFIIVPFLVVALCSLLFLTSLDNKVFDLFLRTIPGLTEDDSVLLITVDDSAIEQVGIFPWTRDILADAIVFLREMGAHTVAFDLSYLDNSPVRVDPVYVQEELPLYLDNGFLRINDTLGQVMDGFSSGLLGPGDAESMKTQLWDFNDSVKNELAVSIDYVTRDVDAYFARTLKFFGNSFLTLTMVDSENLPSDEVSINTSTQSWLENHIALKNVINNHDRRTPDKIDIIPAIYKLISQAKGAGFVNADADKDGYRRRIHLLLKHHGYYYGHLGLTALLDMIGNPNIEVSNSSIILRDAKIKGGAPRDIRIPRARDGSVLMKWPPKDFIDYNNKLSSWELIKYNRLEAAFARNLALMDESGFFYYWDEDESPLEKYNNANYIKELLYEGENPDAGISFETYLDFRQDYLSSCGLFLDGPYEEAILYDVGDDGELRTFVEDVFGKTREQFKEMLEIRETLSARTGGTLAIIGVAATSMTDEGLITFQEQYPNVGTYATVVNMILSGEFLDDAPLWVSLLIAIILSFGLALVIKKLDNAGKFVLAGVFTLLISLVFFLVFFISTKRYVGAVVPVVSVTLTFLSLSGINFFSTIREKSFLRSAFSRYLAPQVIDQIILDPSKLNLGGEKRQMTAIFTDIQGFSTIAEGLDPADLVNLLNRYLTTMSNIVLENRGTIDKYEGDAIIAFFGAPVYVEDHAALACHTAVRMKKAERGLNVQIMEEGLSPSPLFTRVGINTGDMIVGNMGTPNKMDYTIMGNAVNLAARLEGVNKQYHTGGILISEYTREKLGDDFLLRSLDRVRVVGINTPLRLYELLDIRQEADTALIEMVTSWEGAIERYERREFEEALKNFRSIMEGDDKDRVAKLYHARCEQYLKDPPPVDWDGVYNLTQK
ncbi:MAG: CHASE2 domain-containing protein [Treponema sp.]|jgi:adenylate cyclase|nr:CHASE2 domain-containing protein [Treponema sp.]